MDTILKYPRTQHIRGSRLQNGDDDLEAMPFEKIKNHHLVVERKIDGANSGISFDADANILLQSRGHYLTGGFRERHFNLLKTWTNRHIDILFDILGDQYIMYGEFMYALHSVFYDFLPHYFLEFDIMDKKTGIFLSTEARKKLIGTAPIVSVPVVSVGPLDSLDHLISLNGPALYKSSDWMTMLRKVIAEREIHNAEELMESIDKSGLDEGLYVKDEEGDRVVGRYKFVRSDFTQAIIESGTHWLDRPIVPNQLRPGVDIFSDNLPF